MIAESLATGGIVAVALGAIELAKASMAKRRNGSVDVLLKAQDRTMRDLMTETRNQTDTLTEILTIIKMERGQR
ncbi:hypothetical protein LCGC14_1632240 [marine sediment metagenome]|uniref:Uncharacterized protein n=1 Tax=marine sediment metagenome TaxID=412755 RepID=A0A0F9IPH9_9ZZZZ